jgi:hypothetical protein
VSEQLSDAEWLAQGFEDETTETTDVPQPEIDTVEAPEPEQAPDEEQESDEDEEGEEEETEDDSEEGDEEEESVAALAFDTDDPDVLAYLAKYQGDPLKALRAAAELTRAYGRQGTDLAAIRQRAQDLEAQITQARLLTGGVPLSEEQTQWAEGAAASVTPGIYVEQAINAGEFDLARAVCTYWAREDPFNAGRAGQLIDFKEAQTHQQMQAPIEASTGDILEALWENVPGMREWEPQMVSVYQNLGPAHHLVQESRSTNPDIAMRALINIFEIAKASSANVQEQRSQIKKRARSEADNAKAKAAVTSSSNAPSTGKQTPRRDIEIMPGLTLEALETEFASQS